MVSARVVLRVLLLLLLLLRGRRGSYGLRHTDAARTPTHGSNGDKSWPRTHREPNHINPLRDGRLPQSKPSGWAPSGGRGDGSRDRDAAP